MSTQVVGSLVLVGTVMLVALEGCGGAGSGPIFQQNPPDAGTITPSDAGNLLPDANLPDAAVVCIPAPVGNYTPVWKGPNAQHSGACTTQNITLFFDTCLAPTSDPTSCHTFEQANAACVSCLQSNDTDPTYGPIIWHDQKAYFTTNIAGCLAIESGDSSPTGCAASYQGIVSCKELACNACLAAKDPAGFSTCESAATSECGKLTNTCVGEIRDASDPASACLPPAGTQTRDAYLQIAPFFCGQ